MVQETTGRAEHVALSGRIEQKLCDVPCGQAQDNTASGSVVGRNCKAARTDDELRSLLLEGRDKSV